MLVFLGLQQLFELLGLIHSSEKLLVYSKCVEVVDGLVLVTELAEAVSWQI